MKSNSVPLRLILNAVTWAINNNQIIRDHSSTSEVSDLVWEVEKVYNKNNLAYHNWDHIANGIEEIVDLMAHPQCVKEVDYSKIIIAWLFHDIVYVPLSKTNEQDSASQVKPMLESFNVNIKDISRIESLIYATKHDYLPIIESEKIITDIDLLSIGSHQSIFDENSKKIRQEFHMVPEDEYRKGRINFFNNLLKIKENKIFSTSVFEYLNEQALINIKNEIKNLSE